jgi:hypothetical protein
VSMLGHGCVKYAVSGENREKVCLLRTVEFLLNDHTHVSLRHTG